jgi:hypothetical protein
MMTHSAAPIAVVTDVSLGYGTPQAPALARSLAAHFGAAASIFEPDLAAPLRSAGTESPVEAQRIRTDVTPYCAAGRIQYVLRVAEQLNRTRPEIVAVWNTFALPVLAKLNYRPRTTIYVLSEMIEPYGRFAYRLNRSLAGLIDAVVVPDADRARLDLPRAGLTGTPLAVMYNVGDAPQESPLATELRLPRLFYGGVISSDLGMADFLLHSDLRETPLDMYGEVAGPNREALLKQLIGTAGAARYYGRIDQAFLRAERRRRAYSLVLYRPTLEHTRFAAPNKFFEAIADGVPPIVTPHPQCRMFVERYGCGIVIRDWTFEAYRTAVKQALDLFGTRRYARMVENCVRAVREELNWPAQFAKLQRLLPAALKAA